jgi:RAQPRD family integrative conjugative element protein
MRGMRASTQSPSFAQTALLATVLVTVLLWPAPGVGDTDAEREALARLAQELDALAPLIAEAEAQSSPDTRIRFRYDWLRQDLDKIRQGIADHLDAPRPEPRSVPPLRGDYRR